MHRTEPRSSTIATLALPRRQALRLGFGAGGAALLTAATARLAPLTARAQQDEDEIGEASSAGVALPEGAVSIALPFEFAVRQGPSAGLSISGVLTLVLEASGTVSRGVMTDEEGNELATATGQVTGRAISLAFTLPDGRVLYGTGTSRGDLRMGAFELGGPLVGPEPGDAGDWIALGESAQDTTGAIFLLDTAKHVLYRINNIGSPQTLFAGAINVAGLVNGPRLNARFRGPAGIGIRTADNAILIGDTANQVVRLINRGTNMVSTIITAAQARAAVPGLAFVVHGVAANPNRLFIADRNSHCILRVTLATNQVQVLAGAVNQPGMQNGTGTGARFRNPTSLSLSPDNSILNVVDSGNGVIRQITMNGVVSTIGSVSP